MKTRRIAKSSEAGTGVKGLETASFWNWEVSSAPYRRVLSFLLENLNVRGFTRPFFLVTAYSENWLEARSNPGFERALKKADMIVPDGVVLLAGIDFLKEKTGKKGNFGSIRKQNRSRRAADGGSGEIDGRKWRTGFFAGRMEWSSKKVGGEVKG